MEIKNHIIAEADTLFCKYGFKSVTMDDIAKHLGMSKKTIYQHFKDKNELVSLLITEKITSQDCNIKDYNQNAKDAVHELFLGLENLHYTLTEMNPKLLYDLHKYHTEAWLKFREFKEKHLAESIYKNLERGINEGFFRSDINKEIITQLRLEQVDMLFNNSDNYTMNKYNLAQVMGEITMHFLYGICNTKGLELINYYTAQTQNQHA